MNMDMININRTQIVVQNDSTRNKAYRPNVHLLDIFMQLKYQFAIRARFIILIKQMLVLLPVYFCMQCLETKFSKETYMNGHNFNSHTVSDITRFMDY